MIKSSKLTKQVQKKLLEHFCADIDATKTALVIGLNRKTVNRYYNLFRIAIYRYQQSEKAKLLVLLRLMKAILAQHEHVEVANQKSVEEVHLNYPFLEFLNEVAAFTLKLFLMPKNQHCKQLFEEKFH